MERRPDAEKLGKRNTEGLEELPEGTGRSRRGRGVNPDRRRASRSSRAMELGDPTPARSRRLTPWASRAGSTSVGCAHFARKALDKAFPDHWSFLLGEIALYCFIVLVVTGTFLALVLRRELATGRVPRLVPRCSTACTMSAAYRSVIGLSFDVRLGLMMRQMHHWAALLFVGAIVAHLGRIFFTGAFRKPREINWLIGVHAVAARARERLHGLFAARRPAVGHGLADCVLDRAVDPARRARGSRSWCSAANTRRRRRWAGCSSCTSTSCRC